MRTSRLVEMDTEASVEEMMCRRAPGQDNRSGRDLLQANGGGGKYESGLSGRMVGSWGSLYYSVYS